MTSNQIANGILKALGVVLGVCIIIWFLFQIQSVLVYIAIAAVISLIGRPIVLFLRKRLKFKNTLAVVVTMLLLVGVFVGLFLLFIPLIIEQGHNLSLLDINQLQENIESLYVQVMDYLKIRNQDFVNSLKDINFLSKIDYSILPNFLNALVSGIGSFGIGLFSVLFISFFFLKDSKLLENGFLTLVPSGNESRWKKSSIKIKNLLSRYFIGLILQIFILFIIYTVGLLIIGVENAFVIAFLCALLNLIPYVGPLIGFILMVTLTMTSSLGESFKEIILPKAFWVAIVFCAGQLIDNFISQPRIFSAATKAHPLEIFLVILIAGILFGIVGLMVAVPAYTAIKVILKEFLSDNKIVKHLTKNM